MLKKSLSRRRFLRSLAAIPAVSATTYAQAPTQVQGARSQDPQSRSVLTFGDFSYLGRFRMPNAVNGQDAAWGRGLAHRYVGGQLRFFTTNVNQTLYEVSLPALVTSGTPNTAPLVRYWGDFSESKRFTDGNGVGYGQIYGLFWDEVQSRLYWTYAEPYNASSHTDPSIGYSTTNESSGVATPVGVWRFTGRGPKATTGGVLPIPQWFANAYCSGRRLGAGFGGYFSIATVGPVSMGPALCAFSPSDIDATPDRSAIPFTNLVGYPYNANERTRPYRAERDTNYTSDFEDGFNPRNGKGFWAWTDWIWQGGVWIDTPTKHGVIFFPTLGNNRVFYETSTVHAEAASHWWYVYDPMALADVARGRRGQDQVQPSQRVSVQYPGLTYPLPGWADEPYNMITGSTFDAATNRLYIAVRHSFATGEIPSTAHLVHVYQL
jgi:hypothetical protein